MAFTSAFGPPPSLIIVNRHFVSDERQNGVIG
jgi:hypothetical protein